MRGDSREPGDPSELSADLLAQWIAAAVAEKLEGPDSRAGREVMNSEEAADFLRMSLAEFRRRAPTLPRHQITESRYVYLRSELLEWLRSR
jgi:hypothetical protein